MNRTLDDDRPCYCSFCDRVTKTTKQHRCVVCGSNK